MTITEALNAVLQAVLNDMITKADMPELGDQAPDQNRRTVGQVVQQVRTEQQKKLEQMTIIELAAIVTKIDAAAAQNKPAGR